MGKLNIIVADYNLTFLEEITFCLELFIFPEIVDYASGDKALLNQKDKNTIADST